MHPWSCLVIARTKFLHYAHQCRRGIRVLSAAKHKGLVVAVELTAPLYAPRIIGDK